jgi:uncharacterized membrane protein YfcA
VGHAGASGYLAVLTLVVGLTGDEVQKIGKPTALALNILVGTIGTLQFASARQIPWRQLLPFCIGSVPLSFYGGFTVLTSRTYKICLGIVLLAAAARLLLGLPKAMAIKPARDVVAVPVGAAIGLLAGLSGTGGGIFITPLLLLLGWATPKHAAGMSVAFILANSIAGLAGQWKAGGGVPPPQAIGWAVAAGLGGLLGSWYGARRSGFDMLRRLLAIVLVTASIKLLFLP